MQQQPYSSDFFILPTDILKHLIELFHVTLYIISTFFHPSQKKSITNSEHYSANHHFLIRHRKVIIIDIITVIFHSPIVSDIYLSSSSWCDGTSAVWTFQKCLPLHILCQVDQEKQENFCSPSSLLCSVHLTKD